MATSIVVETALEPKKSAGCKRRHRKRAHDMHKPKFHFIFCCFLLLLQQTTSYHRAPCKKVAVRRQFQFTDCYVPNLNPELYLTEASFVLAHDAATGYLNIKGDSDTTSNTNNNGGGAYSNEYDGVDNMNNNNQQNNQQSNNNNIVMNTITTKLLSLYGKTQVGTVYEQLNDGARALDLRPKIFNNGTVGFHHGSLIDIPLTSVTLSSLLAHAKQWCNDNPTELVLIFHSELVHEAGYNGLSSQVYMETDDSLYYEYDYTDDGGSAAGNGEEEENEGERERKLEDQAAQDDQNINDDDQNQQHEQTFAYYYNGIAKIKEIYQEAGVPYRSCDKIAGLTVSQAMDMADLSKFGGKGYLLAVDRHDMYGKLVRVPCGPLV